MPEAPLPEGVTEADYDSIEAAVMETVRGRWFLTEFARRTRAGEISLVLDAVERLQQVVTARSFPAAELAPQARLLVQRAGEIADRMLLLAAEMRAGGLDPSLWSSLESEARAVAGLARAAGGDVPATLEPPGPAGHGARPTPLLETHLVAAPPSAPEPAVQPPGSRAGLAALDALSTAEKLALFA